MLKDELTACKRALESGGIEDAEYEASLMLGYLTGYSRAGLLAHSNETLEHEKCEQLRIMTEKRIKRYPLQYILRKWSFMGFELEVGEGVLIPRDDTEVVTRLCLEYLKGRNVPRVLELCAGSGAICVALSKLCGLSVEAVELSDEAFYFLQKNIKLNNANVYPIKGDIFECSSQFENNSYDLIVSNPPYIKRFELEGLQPEVRFEPKMALDGGESGYDFYEAIISLWSNKLKQGGALALELGENQAERVSRLMLASGFDSIKTALDLGMTQRAVIGIKC